MLKRLSDFNEALLRPLAVGPGSGISLPYLDTVRAFALAWIVTMHIWQAAGRPPLELPVPFTGLAIPLDDVMPGGDAGVDLLFLLSGLLLSLSFFDAHLRGRPSPSLLRYAKSRTLRIIPGYYACLFLMLLFLTPAYIGPGEVYSWRGLETLGAHLAFLQLCFPLASQSWHVNQPLWSLTVEAMFYLVLPLMVMPFRTRFWLLAVPGFVALSLLWMLLCLESFDGWVDYWRQGHHLWRHNPDFARFMLSKQFPAHLGTFAMGILLARVHTMHRLGVDAGPWFAALTSRWAGRAYLAAGLALTWVSLHSEFSPDGSGFKVMNFYLRHLKYGLSFSLVIAGLMFAGPLVRAVLLPAPLRVGGIIGYSIFLWHQPLVVLYSSYPGFGNLPETWKWKYLVMFVWPATLALAFFSYCLIERPFLVIGRRRDDGPAPSPPPGPAAA